MGQTITKMRDSAVSEASTSMAVALLRLGDLDPALITEWQGLGKKSALANPYFEPWFLIPALRHLDPEGEVRLITVRHRGSGQLMGLVPIVFQKGYAKLPLKHVCVWVHRHCFSGAPLVREGHVAAVFGALFDWIDTRPAGACFFRFAHLPLDETCHRGLENACTDHDRDFRIQEHWRRAILTDGNDIESVLKAAMSGKKRKELRRQERRFAELGRAEMMVRPLTSAEDADTVASRFLHLEYAGWKGAEAEGFPLAGTDAETRFFRELMAGGAKAGAIELVSLDLDDAPVAMLITLKSGTHRAAFKTAYDERYGAYSPGVRVLIEASREMLAGDATVFDSCARAGHPVVDGLWSERVAMAQVNIPAGGKGDRLLLGTAAQIEKLKIGALKRLTREEV